MRERHRIYIQVSPRFVWWVVKVAGGIGLFFFVASHTPLLIAAIVVMVLWLVCRRYIRSRPEIPEPGPEETEFLAAQYARYRAALEAMQQPPKVEHVDCERVE